jgi:glutamate-1-semialdehyde 2,1-aminomutase
VRLQSTGKKIQAIWKSAAERTGLALSVSGIPPLAHFDLHVDDAQAARTLFTQLMLDRGFLASNAFYATYAQSEEDIEQYSAAVTEAFGELAQAVDSGTVRNLLKGPVAHVGFSRLT